MGAQWHRLRKSLEAPSHPDDAPPAQGTCSVEGSCPGSGIPAQCSLPPFVHFFKGVYLESENVNGRWSAVRPCAKHNYRQTSVLLSPLFSYFETISDTQEH